LTVTYNQVHERLEKAKADCAKAKAEVEAMIHRWAMGSKSRENDALELILALQGAEFNRGSYNVLYSVMTGNNYSSIEDGRFVV
jgi:hypothetical protein